MFSKRVWNACNKLKCAASTNGRMQQRRRIITEVKGSKYDTPSGTVGPMKEPVAEAGAEPDRGDWEKWYKHFIYIIPLIASMICSIGVINDQSFKQYAEKLSPTYVDFVRKNYAFAEEDLAEMERLDLLEKQLKEPVDATIQWTSTTGSKEELVVTDVAGDVTIPELLKLASQQHPHLPKDWLSSIHQTDISFKSSGDADVDISLSELSNRDQSNREQSSLSYKAGQTETDIETEGGALTRKVVMHRTLREALDALPNGSACSSSTDSWMLSAGSGWAIDRGSDKGAIPVTAQDVYKQMRLLMGLPAESGGRVDVQKNNSLNVYSIPLALTVPYRAYPAYFLDGISRFRTSCGEPASSAARQDMHLGTFMVQGYRELTEWAKKEQKALEDPARQARAVLTQLEGKLRKFQEEKNQDMQGYFNPAKASRQMDDIEDDIRSTKQAITEHKRKYINWFYYI